MSPFRRGDKVMRTSILATALAMSAAAVGVGCGGDDDDDDGGGDGGVTELTATIPFPSGIVFYPLYVAEENGYFEEEGLSVSVQPVDGSGPALQQVLTGRADMALATPSDTMAATIEGADLTSVYTLYQSNVFSVVAEPGEGVDTLDDLEGETIGVGSKEGGETDFLKALLVAEQDWREGENFELLAVGDGGSATVALSNDEVPAYAASFPDVAIMRLRGLELQNIVPEDFQGFFDSTVAMETSFVDENTELVEGLGRALAKATVFGLENPEETLDITGEAFPEEIQDREFALALLEETQSLFELPECADDQWGYACEEAVQGVMDYLVETEQISEPVDPGIFTNEFVDAYNDFDESEVK
jgi:NitT/TauT family transport system substrate-binding protein